MTPSGPGGARPPRWTGRTLSPARGASGIPGIAGDRAAPTSMNPLADNR
ncbi:hypothetical protein ACFYW9_11425 [Streptomyces sp. NPDC002698]